MASWTNWYGLTPSTLQRVPESPGVYEVALDGRRHPYPHGYSSTIYFGKADVSIASRLRMHYNGRGNAVIAELLEDGHPLVARWWRTLKEPRAVECNLFSRFADRFGSRPLGNIRGCR